ncbi:MAG: hypothetical protein K0U29_03000 [Gammaproteobacteria bacterium]|nr:hypothetical protein [Gammaproteobacteria bacterium]MCH9743879.1 hypothetical protein [Gammaproteobacteria bacterium]
MEKTNKHFVSEIDQELAKFDREKKPSEAQRDETKKYKKICKLRDEPIKLNEDMGNIWD